LAIKPNITWLICSLIIKIKLIKSNPSNHNPIDQNPHLRIESWDDNPALLILTEFGVHWIAKTLPNPQWTFLLLYGGENSFFCVFCQNNGLTLTPKNRQIIYYMENFCLSMKINDIPNFQTLTKINELHKYIVNRNRFSNPKFTAINVPLIIPKIKQWIITAKWWFNDISWPYSLLNIVIALQVTLYYIIIVVRK